MKCPRCWTDKAYTHPVPGWKGLLLAVLMRMPMKCHHCYHKFSVFWFSRSASGTAPNARLNNARPIGVSYAAQHYAAMRQETIRPFVSQGTQPSRTSFSVNRDAVERQKTTGASLLVFHRHSLPFASGH